MQTSGKAKYIDIMNIKKNKGFSTIELFVTISVLGIFLVIIYPIFSYSRKASNTMNNLDVYHDVRRIDQVIFDDLKLGSGIVYPPRPDDYGETDWYNQLIFRNHLNQTIMIYVNKNDKLLMFNYDNVKGNTLSLGKIIGSHIKEFKVRRHGSSVVEYRISFEIEKKDFVITNRVTLVNVL